MSGTRGERLERLRRVQEKRREIEEWRLAELVRKEGALAGEARDILFSLGETSGLAGLFLEAKSNALRRKEAERAQTARLADDARRRLAEASKVEKRIERVAAEARGAERQAEEAASLAEILDAHLSARRASLE